MKWVQIILILSISFPTLACQFHGGSYGDYLFSQPPDSLKDIDSYSRKAKENLIQPKKKTPAFFKFKHAQRIESAEKDHQEQKKPALYPKPKPTANEKKSHKPPQQQGN